MSRRRWLRLVLYLNVLIVGAVIGYKVYLDVFDAEVRSVHARQVEAVQQRLEGRESFRFAVAGNILPRPMREWMDALLAGDFTTASERLKPLLPVFEALMAETNPIPVKAAAAMMGLVEPYYRLPMVPPSERTTQLLQSVLEPFNVRRVA